MSTLKTYVSKFSSFDFDCYLVQAVQLQLSSSCYWPFMINPLVF